MNIGAIITDNFENPIRSTFDHFYSAREAIGGPDVELRLIEWSLSEAGVQLTYEWRETLSKSEGDKLDTETRAFFNCIIPIVARAAGIKSEKTESPARLRDVPVPIPGWKLDGIFRIPVYVVKSQFDVVHRVLRLWVGTVFYRKRETRSVLFKLEEQFRRQWRKCYPPSFIDSLLLHEKAFDILQRSDRDSRGIIESAPAAMNLLKTAVKVAPNNADALNELGFLYSQLARVASVLDERQDLFSALDLSGYARREPIQLFLDLAEEAYEKAVIYAPGNPTFRNNLAAVRLERARRFESKLAIADAAFSVYEDVDLLLQNNADYAPAYLTKARLLAISGNPKNMWLDVLEQAREVFFTASRMGSGLLVTPDRVKDTIDRNSVVCYQDYSLWQRATVDLPFRSVFDYWQTSPFPSRLGPFDFFVSYNREDADFVRPIVDYMIACGMKIWFDEYQVLLSGHAAWEDAVDRGIYKSGFAIVFVSKSYHTSKPCQYERRLLEENKLTYSQIDLCDKMYKDGLGHWPSDYAISSMREVVEQIRKRNTQRELDFGVWSDRTCHREAVPYVARSFTYLALEGQLDMAGWKEAVTEESDYPSSRVKDLPVKLRLSDQSVDLYVELIGRFEEKNDELYLIHDSQEIRDRAINYARIWASKTDAVVRGVHISTQGKIVRVAVTYKVRQKWNRKIWLILPVGAEKDQPRKSVRFEFTYTFSGTFRQYCQNVWRMDQLARTLRWPTCATIRNVA